METQRRAQEKAEERIQSRAEQRSAEQSRAEQNKEVRGGWAAWATTARGQSKGTPKQDQNTKANDTRKEAKDRRVKPVGRDAPAPPRKRRRQARGW